MIKEWYARWMYEWETRLTTRDENRVVRPLEWGFEWIAPFLERNGLGAALPGPEVVHDKAAAEAAMVRINQLLIRHSDAFFGYERPTDRNTNRKAAAGTLPHKCPSENPGPGSRDSQASRRGKAGESRLPGPGFP